MIKNPHSGLLTPFDFDNLLNHVPELHLLDLRIDSYCLEKPIDSSDVQPNFWLELALTIKKLYNDYFGFVILHGTDTMSYTASALSFMLNGLQKPIIFTGSQLPIGDLRTDAKENLITSLHYASLEDINRNPIIQEITLYFEYKLFRANRTTKWSATQFDAYLSPNYPALGESGVSLEIQKNMLFYDEIKSFHISEQFSTEIVNITYYPGIQLDLLEKCLENHPPKLIILQVYGTGTISNDSRTIVFLKKLRTKGSQFLIVSQCRKGSVNFHTYQNSKIFDEIGAINGKDLTFEAAVTKSMIILPQSKSEFDFKNKMERNLKGELTE